MSELSHHSSKQSAVKGPSSSGDTVERRVKSLRETGETAPARCLMYAIFSDIVASPFDAEAAVARDEIQISQISLPYTLTNSDEYVKAWRERNVSNLKSEYSGLFEVGSDGPPVPIREDLHRNQPAGVREDIVRFYDYFGYGLAEKFAWAPDHLSVELEFMHFLAYKESECSAEDAASFQLAQHDFAERHLVIWVSELAQRIVERQPDALYGKLVAALSEFVVKDFEWQRSTIESIDKSAN